MGTLNYCQSVSVQVQSADVQNVTIKRIIKTNKRYTHLEVKINQQLEKFQVTNRRLAKAFGFKPEEDSQEKLNGKMPLSAKVKVEGNTIKQIEKM